MTRIRELESRARRLGSNREQIVREFQEEFPNLFEAIVTPPQESWLGSIDLERVVQLILGRRRSVTVGARELGAALVRAGIVDQCAPAWAGRLARMIAARGVRGVVVRVRRTAKARRVEFSRMS